MKRMNRPIAFVMSVILAVGSLTACGNVYAADRSDDAQTMAKAEMSAAAAGTIEAASITDVAADLLNSHGVEQGKEENVYIIADANGTPKKKIVSAWLKNPEGRETIKDQAKLTDIENVKGDEAYSENADGTMEWATDGKDIYYQGQSDEALPVDTAITYELNGKAVTAEELEGATGHLKMTFNYTNNTKTEKVVDGRTVTMYQPFTVVSGTMMDNAHVSNIEVTNGRIINSGDQTMIVGMAMPGLKESLGLNDFKKSDGERVDLDIPESVVIEADVADFSLLTTITVMENSLLNSVDLDKVSTIDDLKHAMNRMTDASSQLVDGTKTLKDGVQTLSDGTAKLADGAKQLDDGAGALNDGASALAGGAKQVDDGAAALREGITAVDGGADQLNGGAGQLAAGTSQLKTGVYAFVQGIHSLDEGAGRLSTGIDTLAQSAAGLPENIGKLKAGADTVEANLGTLADSAQTMSAGAAAIAGGANTLSENANQLSQGASAIQDAADQLSTLASSTNVTLAKNAIASTIASLQEAQAAGVDVSGSLYQMQALQVLINTYGDSACEAIGGIAAGADQLAAGASALSEGSTQLAGKVNELSQGASAISDGARQLAAGAGQVSAGAGQLAAGSQQLTAGVAQISDGAHQVSAGTAQLDGNAPALKDGVDQVDGGASQLAAGTKDLKDGTGQLTAGSSALKDGTTALASGASDLKNGTATLKDGTSDLVSGTTELTDGVAQLLEGAIQLMDGMNQFDQDAIQKLADIFNDDAEMLIDRIKALQDYSEEYCSFSGDKTDTTSTVRFIMRTESIGK